MCVLSPPGGPRVAETGVDVFLSVTVDELLAPPRHSSSFEKGVGGGLLSMIACSGCCHGAPQALGAVAGAGRALNSRKVFAHSSAGRKSKIRCCQGSPRPADGHVVAPPCLCPHLLSPEGHRPCWVRTHLMTPSALAAFSKAPSQDVPGGPVARNPTARAGVEAQT